MNGCLTGRCPLSELRKNFFEDRDLTIVRLENIANLKDYDTLLYAVDEFVLVCAKRHPLVKPRRVSLDVIAQ